MPDSFITVPLTSGLDLNTPALQKTPGSLVDCLNYEITDSSGYRRIDGFEKYDGFLTGDLSKLWVVSLGSVPPGQQGSYADRIIYAANYSGSLRVEAYKKTYTPIGYYINVLAPGGFVYMIYVPLSADYVLQSTDTFYRRTGSVYDPYTPLGNSSDLQELYQSLDPLLTQEEKFLQFRVSLHAAQIALRAQVTGTDKQVVGLHWFNKNLIVFKDLINVRVDSANANTMPPVGGLIRWNGQRYRVVKIDPLSPGDAAAPGGSTGRRFTLTPVSGTATPVSTAFIHINNINTAILTINASVATPADGPEEYAGAFYYPTPEETSTRGLVAIAPATSFFFNLGSYTGAPLPPDTVMSNYYYVTNGAGKRLRVRLEWTRLDSGTFAASNAIGRATLSDVTFQAGPVDYIENGDEVHNVFPTTGTSRVFVVNSVPTLALLPGSGALCRNNSRYVFDTANFYGNETLDRVYGAHGCGRAFWCDLTTYGSIYAQEDATLDVPRHARHFGGQLALGFKSGSVQLSVLNLPLNFSGLSGALEVAMGDPVTGLLELQGDTLGVFCRRSIRRLSGHTDASLTREVVSRNQGALEYTVVETAGQAVFCTSSGISTLEQSAAYGDFTGDRISSKVSAWLRPRMAFTPATGDAVGVSFAYPVRNKNQYRVVFRDGLVLSVALAQDGPSIMKSRYSLNIYQPVRSYCVSSEVGSDGVEYIHTAWDSESRVFSRQRQVYQMDCGWGFNGERMLAWLDLAHIFPSESHGSTGIEVARLYGQSYGLGRMNLFQAGIEKDFLQPYGNIPQDISMPYVEDHLADNMEYATSVIDTQGWGLGIKLGIYDHDPATYIGPGYPATEPSHLCQVLVMQARTEGAKDQ